MYENLALEARAISRSGSRLLVPMRSGDDEEWGCYWIARNEYERVFGSVPDGLKVMQPSWGLIWLHLKRAAKGDWKYARNLLLVKLGMYR